MNSCTTLKATNNYAASLIVAGHYKQAYKHLRQAMGDFAEDVLATATKTSYPSHQTAFPILALTSEIIEGMFAWPIIASAAEQHQQDNVMQACALAFYNMALSCHLLTQETDYPEPRRQQILTQAKTLYQTSFDIGRKFDMKILNVAISMNLMELAFDEGNLASLHGWEGYFMCQVEQLPEESTPSDILLAAGHAHLCYCNLSAARAA